MRAQRPKKGGEGAASVKRGGGKGLNINSVASFPSRIEIIGAIVWWMAPIYLVSYVKYYISGGTLYIYSLLCLPKNVLMMNVLM